MDDEEDVPVAPADLHWGIWSSYETDPKALTCSGNPTVGPALVHVDAGARVYAIEYLGPGPSSPQLLVVPPAS